MLIPRVPVMGLHGTRWEAARHRKIGSLECPAQGTMARLPTTGLRGRREFTKSFDPQSGHVLMIGRPPSSFLAREVVCATRTEYKAA